MWSQVDLRKPLRTKLVEVMELQLSYFKSWKMMLWKCSTQYASKFGKLSSGHRTGKGQFSFQSQRNAMPKNPQTTVQLYKAGLQQYINCELPNVQADSRKGRGTRDRSANIEKAREFQENNYFCFIDNGKALDCVDHNKLWKILQEMGISEHLTCLLKSVCRSKSNS